nr:AraC family transcriptional regulator [Lysobacter enzymogenes]
MALIEQAIAAGEEPPELGRLAEAAAFSPFHFHRVYRAMTGETTGQTVARLRLLQGLRVLADGGRSVTDAALAVGYQTRRPSPARCARASAAPRANCAPSPNGYGARSTAWPSRPRLNTARPRRCGWKWSAWSRSRSPRCG